MGHDEMLCESLAVKFLKFEMSQHQYCVTGARGQRHSLSSISRLLQQLHNSIDSPDVKSPSNGEATVINETQSRSVNGLGSDTQDIPLQATVSAESVSESDVGLSVDGNPSDESSRPDTDTPDDGVPRRPSKIKKQVAFHDPTDGDEQADDDGEARSKSTAVVGDPGHEDENEAGYLTNGIGRRGSKKRRSSRKKLNRWKQQA